MATKVKVNQIDTNLRDGWTAANESWAYASASTITVPSGAASKYQKGDRLRWKQGGAYKYGVIVTVADTLLTIAVNTDYTVADSAITDNYYSHQANPIGYPGWFAYTPTLTSNSAWTNAPTVGSNSSFCINGITLTVRIDFTFNANSGGSSWVLATLPVNAVKTGFGGYGFSNAGFQLMLQNNQGAGGVTIYKYEGSSPIGNSNVINAQVTYQI